MPVRIGPFPFNMISTQPTVVGRRSERLSAWTTLVSRSLSVPGVAEPQEFHSLAQADYVTILGVTPDRKLPLVRQFRPALEKITLELPGGLLDSGEDPAVTAARELYEETGYRTTSSVHALGRLCPDTGRLENGFWCFFAEISGAPDPAWIAERNVEPVLFSHEQLRTAILDGTFDHALHIALVAMAMMRGHFKWD